MAGFFSLAGGGRGGATANGQDHRESATNRPHGETNPESWFIYRNDDAQEIPAPAAYSNNKGFELWQDQPQHHHVHHHLNNNPLLQDLYSSAIVGLGVGPIRSTADGAMDENQSRSAAFVAMMRCGSGGGGGISCQDCGNQAKKDCSHMRCRTCCKSRGFPCQTHVKSTWVPAAKRRERHQQQQQQRHHHSDNQQRLRLDSGGGGGSSSRELLSTPKRRHREDDDPAATAAGLELGNFPGKVSATAAFQCVRMRSVDDGGDDQYAYQASVTIGGHLFKGILYDEGPEEAQYHHMTPAGEASSGCGSAGGGLQAHHHQNHSSLLISTAGAASSRAATDPDHQHGGSGYVDPSSTYPDPFMAAGSFFPPPARS